MFGHCLNLNLLNKYLEAVIECLEPNIFNENVDVLFDFFNLLKKHHLSH